MTLSTETLVIFRRWKRSGKLIAIFPEIPGTDAWWADCYAYPDGVFQFESMVFTVAAGHKEARAMAQELTSMGYRLKTVLRAQAAHLTKRKIEIEEKAV